LAYIICALASARKNGFTASIMKAVTAKLENTQNVEVGVLYLHDYDFGPCRSCFSCIRNPGGGCVRDDDWGRKGEGILYKAMKRANGLMIFDPVYFAGTSAMGRLFLERIYPLMWEGVSQGLPFASVSCAGNQGFQLVATEEYCKFAAAAGLRYVGGIPAHIAYLEEATTQAIEMSLRLAEAALEDERSGRKPLTDEELFRNYMDTPFDFVDCYLENLTAGTFDPELSIPVMLASRKGLENPEAQDLLLKCCDSLKETLDLYTAGERDTVPPMLSKTAKLWTNAMLMEYGGRLLDGDVPDINHYRPLDNA